MLQSFVNILASYKYCLGKEIRALSTCPHDFLNTNLKDSLNIFGNFRHFEAKLIHDCITLCMYRYSEAQIHEHSGEILSFW